jgi:hypothetical protein
MSTVTSSSYTVGVQQADGRSPIVESHLLSDGRVITFDYLADESIDRDLVLSLRAERVAAELAAREAAEGIAASGEIPLTKLEFRGRFTEQEQREIDAFNAGFESHPGLTTEQKAAVRTALKNLDSALDVRLTDPRTIAGMQMYVALGLLAPERAAEILSNG